MQTSIFKTPKLSFNAPRLVTLAALIAMLAQQGTYAAVAISSVPVEGAISVKPNLLLAIDDSGSMDGEMLFNTNDGALWWNATTKSFVGLDGADNPSKGALNFNNDGGANATWKKYIYLFPNGQANPSDGRRVYPDEADDHFAVPPTYEFAFTRSSDYNGMYYNPKVVYKPWFYGGDTQFINANPAAASYDPVANPGFTVNLAVDRTASGDNETFRLQPGMRDSSGNVVSAVKDEVFTFYPATYYVKIKDDIAFGGTYNCSRPDPQSYIDAVNSPSILFNAQGRKVIDALGPDGGCLRKYEIKATTLTFPNGNNYVQEIQNFANWFTYYRKRHLAARAGFGQAFNGFKGFYAGAYRISQRKLYGMYDMDASATRKDLYNYIYSIGGRRGGTPNREALMYAGQLFSKADTLPTPRPDIVTRSCQRNAAILFTDGFSNPAVTGLSNVDGNDGAPFADTFTNTIADVAMNYYKNNLRPDLPNDGPVKVPSQCSNRSLAPRLDCNTQLHMNTYAVTLGASGYIFGKTHFTPDDAFNSPPAWADPSQQRSPHQVDDLYHATINGRGLMLRASDAVELQTKLAEIVNRAIGKETSSNAVIANSTILKSGSAIFQANYQSDGWTGDLMKFEFDGDGNLGTQPTWRASLNMPNASERKIYTRYNNVNREFSWQSPLGALEIAVESQLPTAARLNLRTGQQLLNYFRGDDSAEGTTDGDFRSRTTRVDGLTVHVKLGDIVHSSPLYVGAPQDRFYERFTWAGANTYRSFVNSKLNRKPVVYVGANDGMLHAFDAANGKELFAYVPGALVSRLGALASQNYSHQYFVDGEVNVADVFDGTNWKTILVGTTGRGGNTIFALDVTDPTNFDATKVLWEVTIPQMGNTLSKPIVSLLANGQWSVIVGNGYNSSGFRNGGTEQSALIVLNALTGAAVDGGGDFYISTGQGSSVAPNGMSSPFTWDNDRDGKADYIYAGDHLGYVWRFEVKGDRFNQWGGPLNLFRAMNGATPQPITGGVTVSMNPEDGKRWVFFGTGRLLSVADRSDKSVQTWYGLIDGSANISGRDKLVKRTISTLGTVGSRQVRLVSAAQKDDMTDKSGWYMDLFVTDAAGNNAPIGERIVSSPVFFGSVLQAVSNTPNPQVCEAGGESWSYAINPYTGAGLDFQFFDFDRDGNYNDADDRSGGKIPSGFRMDGLSAGITPVLKPNDGSGSGVTARNTSAGTDGKPDSSLPDTRDKSRSGRLSWRELLK
ncbi:MAG TPA: PilC/PilY family type IV pilus protein [Burkholderiaceae bacterium]|nr:PilC/PilY family type IV pilus protein [Burkholderiaceae bacterium]